MTEETATRAAEVDGDDAAARDGRRRHALVLLLAVNSGATDAIGVLALGGAFTSVMTGNMVLAGVGAARADLALATLAVAAIVAFAAGCGVGARVAGTPQRDDGPWPRAISTALLLQTALTFAFGVTWWVVRAEPDDALALVLLCVNAVALGVQSSAVQRFGVPGLSTTYLTGTLTTSVVRLATGNPLRAVRPSLQVMGALVVGAAIAALVTLQVPLVAPGLQLTCLVLVLALAWWWFLRSVPRRPRSS